MMLLVVSGFDPSAGAGILQDVKSLSLLGITAMGVVSAHTVQNSNKVFSLIFRKWEEIDRELTVLPEPDFIKIGLASPEIVKLVREKFKNAKIIWNIILSSSSGYYFESEQSILDNLKFADYVVLNNDEAKRLNLSPSEKCIVTCGHDANNKDVIRVHYKHDIYEIKRVYGQMSSSFHGTGCAFSSLLTGFLSLGYPVTHAIQSAMEVLEKVLELSTEVQQVQTEKLARNWMKSDAIDSLEKIIPEIEAIGEYTIPEVGQNISYAMPWSTNEFEVAKFPGRIRKMNGRPVFVYGPSFKDRSHTARMALSAKNFSPYIRCVTNIKFEEEYVENARKSGLKIYKYDRGSEPNEVRIHDGQSMHWMISKAVEEFGEIPDIIYDDGWIGKEAMIRVFGRNPDEVMKKVKKVIDSQICDTTKKM